MIDGSRGILQGTSSLLLCFDESEVRKIIRECKKVLDYLAVAEVIESMEDLVQFVKDLSPCLTRVSREVDARQKELTHQVHRDILVRCLEQVKTLAPILICSMKIFIQIASQGMSLKVIRRPASFARSTNTPLSTGGKGNAEAAENRNYLAGRMTDEINEIIRVLQLTTYDEDEWDADQLTAMKRACNALDSKMQAAVDWLEVSPKNVALSFIPLNWNFLFRTRMPAEEVWAKSPSARSSSSPKRWLNTLCRMISEPFGNSAPS